MKLLYLNLRQSNHNITNNIDGVYSSINDDLTNTNTPLQSPGSIGCALIAC